ncbi:MAG TPA: helix-turn-helix domain-containing protein [Clostridiales bacterium]|nr:helix-turn-helix domain-containing protein [Clostridiales bacterium]
MFDHIHFMDFDFSIPTTFEELEKNKERLRPIYQNMDDYSAYLKNDRKNVTFTLEGESRTIGLVPISSFAESHLLYIQVFSLMNTGKHFNTRRKNYSSYLLLYTYEGNGILEYENKKYEMSKGMGFFIDCRKPHSYYTNGAAWFHSVLHFNGKTASWFYKRFNESGSVNFYCPIDGFYQSELEQLLKGYQEISPYREFEVSMKLESLLMKLLKDKNKDSQAIPDYIKYLQRYMESNFTNQLTLDGLSSFAGVSKFHLSREFKKYTGYSPNAYLIELRISKAKLLLSNSSLPIYKISELSGFMNEVNFINLFKSRTGATPTAYRGGTGPGK